MHLFDKVLNELSFFLEFFLPLFFSEAWVDVDIDVIVHVVLDVYVDVDILTLCVVIQVSLGHLHDLLQSHQLMRTVHLALLEHLVELVSRREKTPEHALAPNK